MARPKKFTLDFFVHDANARNDRRLKPLIRKHGNDGYATYFCLLEMLCSEDEIKLNLSNSIDLENAAAECNLRDEAHFHKILITCIELGLFDRQLWEGERVLFCPALHDRYVQRLEDRKQAAIRQQRKSEADNLQKRINQVEGVEAEVITELPGIITRDNDVSSRDKPPDIRDQNLEIRTKNLDLSLDPDGVREKTALPSDPIAPPEPEARQVTAEVLPHTEPVNTSPVQPAFTQEDDRSAAPFISSAQKCDDRFNRGGRLEVWEVAINTPDPDFIAWIAANDHSGDSGLPLTVKAERVLYNSRDKGTTTAASLWREYQRTGGEVIPSALQAEIRKAQRKVDAANLARLETNSSSYQRVMAQKTLESKAK